jgi:Ca2+-transporting ATPase
VFLTLVNRSFYYSVLKTMAYPNRLVPFIIVVTLVVLFTALYLPGAQRLFDLYPIGADWLLRATAVAAVSVLWIEIYKFVLRKRERSFANGKI